MNNLERLVEMKEINKKLVAATTSLLIAQKFGREHKNILQSLDHLIAEGEFNELNFQPVKYLDNKGEKRKMLLLDEELATVFIMRMTGTDVVKWQREYVQAFRAMRNTLAKLSEKDSIRAIFEDQVLKLPREYKKEFGTEFFGQVYRLWGLDSSKYRTTPTFFGGVIRDYVYKNFCDSQGVILEMLDKVNPVVTSNLGNRYRKHCFFQFINEENLLPQFRSHRDKIIGIMASSVNKRDFKNRWSIVFHSADKLLQLAS